MNTKKMVAVGMLIALIGTQCHGAAQPEVDINNAENLARAKTNEINRISRDTRARNDRAFPVMAPLREEDVDWEIQQARNRGIDLMLLTSENPDELEAAFNIKIRIKDRAPILRGEALESRIDYEILEECQNAEIRGTYLSYNNIKTLVNKASTDELEAALNQKMRMMF